MAVPQVFGLFSFVAGEARHAVSAEWAAHRPWVAALFADAMVGGAPHELLFLKTILEADAAFYLGVCEWLSFRSSRIIYLQNIPWNYP